MTFDRADFTGDVDVNHPQLALKSQELALLFEERIKPATRPANPRFSSGPCSKRPGWSLDALSDAALGRSHRAKVGKSKLKQAIDLTREVLQVPAEQVEHRVLGFLVLDVRHVRRGVEHDRNQQPYREPADAVAIAGAGTAEPAGGTAADR